MMWQQIIKDLMVEMVGKIRLVFSV